LKKGKNTLSEKIPFSQTDCLSLSGHVTFHIYYRIVLLTIVITPTGVPPMSHPTCYKPFDITGRITNIIVLG